VPRISVLLLNFVFICGAAWAQQQAPPADRKGQAVEKEQAPPEEDETRQPVKEYAFNPLQAQRELRVGNFYFRQGKYKAAANRFSEAVKWNPALAEGYFRLGQAEEKLRDQKAAREAYAKFVQLAP
jgi:tetratricopeptide (TPR) repeat protein